nr:unnamed protein product [Callosobruchus analis]
MWAGIFGTTIIGPFFYHNNLTTEHYLHLLHKFATVGYSGWCPCA